MMKLTLLSVVQSYLNRVSDFYVNSIFDSESAQQAATIAEEVYYSMTQKFRDWEFTTTLSTLDSVSDADKPNYLKLPDGLQRLHGLTLSYNNVTNDRDVDYQNVQYLEPHDFLTHMERRSDKADNTQVVEDFGGTSFVIYNNTYPRYWTSFDGVYVVFDAYHSGYETTLHESKSRAMYNKEDVFLQQDNFVIPIPEHLSELYRDAVIIECYEHLLQQSAPPSMTRRMASRMATAQQHERKTGSMNRGKRLYGR
jgi:hypothetical protein